MPRRFHAKLIGVRLRPQKRELIFAAAQAAGETLREFSRRATIVRARKVLARSTAESVLEAANQK